MAETNHHEECYSSVAQDRLAAAYLWQALLEHKAAMEERQTEETLELTESFDANEVWLLITFLQIHTSNRVATS